MTELMTMRDIAALARVQRPVVTTWRRRSRTSVHPFPAPHDRLGDQELFARDEVVTWLEDTQRGNNPDVRADAAAHSLLATGKALDAEALSALITLRHLAGAPLAGIPTVDDLLDLADGHDPDDRFLFAELERATDLVRLARTADDLVEAAWSEPAAHRRLMDARLRGPGTALAQVALTEEARRRLLAWFAPLAAELGHPAVMDPTGGAVDVLAEVAGALESSVLLMAGSTPVHRLVRRQLLLADVSRRSVDRESGDWSVTGPVAHLLVLPSAERPAATALDHLDLLDEIALQLDGRQLVLCLAPAATLVDPLDGDALTRRDQLLRDGHVRAVVRLPAGLRPAQARELSALWLLGAADPMPPAERRTLVADLADRTLASTDGLTDDLLAAWQGADGARRRSWAHLYPVPSSELVSASASLVPPRPRRAPAASRTGSDWVVDLRAADVAGRLAAYRLTGADGRAEPVTIAQAIERGWIRVLPGRRIDLDGLPAGNVPVLGAGVRGPASAQATGRSVDRLALMARTDTDFTDPGDIVFTVRPHPAAVLDSHGGAVVVAPARVLRLRPGAPLVAASVVARINAATTTTWRAWTLATVAEPDRVGLGEALADLASERARLGAELARLDALTRDLTTAVETRQLSITKENHGPSAR